MRLNEFFHDKTYENDSLVKKPSSFTPFPERDEHLDRYCDFLTSLASNLENIPIEQQRDNLTRFERSALKELIELRDSHRIVIMPADKGGAVVVLNADHYKQMVENVFYDPEYFEECAGNLMKETIGKINSFCNKYSENLTKDEKTFLTNFDFKEANFYGLPKVHKSQLIKDAVREQASEVVTILNPSDLKIRPIIGGPASPTSHLSMLLDKILKPYMMKLPSFVKDSTDLLRQSQEWESYENEQYTLITMDITNMYMNIREALGIKAIRYFLTEYPELLNTRFSIDLVIDGVLLVLRNNVSYFDGHFRRQTLGCAMGSHKSPPYASLAVGYVEKETYERLRLTKGDEYANYVRTMLRRFLDDIFLKWKLSLGDPNDLFETLNNIDNRIKFTMESGRKIPFLDVHFELSPSGSLSTDIYYKQTDTHNFVQFGSFHPRKTLTNIPYSLARRICIIVSDTTTRDFRLNELKSFLLRKKYPEGVIDSGISRAKQLNRTEILREVETTDSQESNDINFVFTNNCQNPKVLDLVRDSLKILTPSERMKSVMHNKKIVAARRQPRNMRSLLFCPRFDSTTPIKGSVIPCRKDPSRTLTRGRPCKCCDLLSECTHITFHGTTTPFEIRHNFTCDSKNVIYAITCGGCGQNYIGKTEREVRQRCGEYRLAIENKKFTQGVHEHIFNCGNGNFVMTPFFKIHNNNRDSQTILAYETLFIKKFQPQLNILKL